MLIPSFFLRDLRSLYHDWHPRGFLLLVDDC